MHTPVLLEQAIEALNIKPNGLYIDATAGEGGHIQKILEKGGKVLGIDWDEDQVRSLKSKVRSEHVNFETGSFADIESLAKKKEFVPVDGVLFDFGLSMKQIRESGRGFSYNNPNEPLDMRISLKTEVTASEIINSYSTQELYETFSRYAEEFHSLSIAQSIGRAREIKPIETVGSLLAAIDSAIQKCSMNHRHGRDIYATVFQALRIAVNDEFTQIKKGLEGAKHILKPDGRIVTITFHSLEDRIVKRYVESQEDIMFLKKHVIKGDFSKSFERSAKLRIIVKK